MRNQLGIGIALVAACLTSGGAARADEKLYASLGAADAEAMKALKKIEDLCVAFEMDRGGPTRAERRRCDDVYKKAVALGPRAAVAALKSLDRSEHPEELAFRCYGIAGKTGDLSLIEPLVAGIEKMQSAKTRRWELFNLQAALADLTFARIGQRAPWQEYQEVTRGVVTAAAGAWRSWLAAHPSPTRESLLAEGIADARNHVGDPDLTRAWFAATFLAERAEFRSEGRKALEALLGRKHLPMGSREELREALRRYPAIKDAPRPVQAEDAKQLRS